MCRNFVFQSANGQRGPGKRVLLSMVAGPCSLSPWYCREGNEMKEAVFGSLVWGSGKGEIVGVWVYGQGVVVGMAVGSCCGSLRS